MDIDPRLHRHAIFAFRFVPVNLRRRGRRLAAFALGLWLVSGCVTIAPGGGANADPSRRDPPPALAGLPDSLDGEARRWVETTLAGLTTRAKAGQLVNMWIEGGYVSTDSAEFDTLVARVTGSGLGGVTISIGLPHEYVAKLNALQARTRVPLLVTADLEAGPGTRLAGSWALPSMLSMGGGTTLPPPMAFGAIGEERFARELGRITGVEARAVGVHLAFAPVLDVNSNPENPIINTRAFGGDPARVARLGAAFIAGADAAGLQTTAKHFPGHGDTRIDSHVALPTVSATRVRLDTLELVPFRRAIDAGVDAVMTAHIAFPGVPGSDGLPATLSPWFLERLLREELGFDGLVVTDAMTMGAIRERHGPGEAAVRAVAAGADIVLGPPDPREAVDAIATAVESGRIGRNRLDTAVRRVLEAKARAGLHRERFVAFEPVQGLVGTRAHRTFAESAAVRSITLVRDREGRVPIDLAATDRVLSLTLARPEDVPAGRTFDRRLAVAIDSIERARVGPSSGPSAYAPLAVAAREADLVVASAYLPPTAGEETVVLTERFRAFLADLVHEGIPLVLVSFGSPYLLEAVPDLGSYLLAWSGAPLMQEAAAAALLGGAPISGRIPVALPPYGIGHGLVRRPGLAAPEAVGIDAGRLARVDSIIAAAIADSVTPGAAVAVGRRGRLVLSRGYGRIDPAPSAPPASDTTLYDLASLTKAVATTSALMLLAADGTVVLDEPARHWLPWFDEGGEERITVRQLLRHRSGLPGWRPLWREREGRDAFRAALAGLPRVAAPGDTTIYSDLGFMVLGFLAEAAAGESLDEFLHARLYAPLGMDDTAFRPASDLLPRIAPTEVDTFAGRGHVRGVVHDENAWALGGVAGHAGLFSTARDLAAFAEELLKAWREPGPRVFDPAIVRQFTTLPDDGSSRALGWATAAGAPADRGFTARAFGHPGFTGTSLWIDPGLDLFVVLLTNRVNPTRERGGHEVLRRAVHEAVACAVVDPPVCGEEES